MTESLDTGQKSTLSDTIQTVFLHDRFSVYGHRVA
jgi:hypothetical protein